MEIMFLIRVVLLGTEFIADFLYSVLTLYLAYLTDFSLIQLSTFDALQVLSPDSDMPTIMQELTSLFPPVLFLPPVLLAWLLLML